MHESWNIGLDPSIDIYDKEESKDGSIAHSDNLWPESAVWEGAADFVGPFHAGHIVVLMLLTEKGQSRILVRCHPSFAFEAIILTRSSAVLALGQSLFPLFALALDLPEDFFADKVRDS